LRHPLIVHLGGNSARLFGLGRFVLEIIPFGVSRANIIKVGERERTAEGGGDDETDTRKGGGGGSFAMGVSFDRTATKDDDDRRKCRI
jgi:hypothetical protein